MPDEISAADYLAMVEAKKPRKYRNEPTEIDGIKFDSRKEAGRYFVLKRMQNAGEITGLERQPRFPIEVNGVKITRYTADFAYTDANGDRVVEDVKSSATKTRPYVMRKKLVKALYGIDVKEV